MRRAVSEILLNAYTTPENFYLMSLLVKEQHRRNSEREYRCFFARNYHPMTQVGVKRLAFLRTCPISFSVPATGATFRLQAATSGLSQKFERRKWSAAIRMLEGNSEHRP